MNCHIVVAVCNEQVLTVVVLLAQLTPYACHKITEQAASEF